MDQNIGLGWIGLDWIGMCICLKKSVLFQEVWTQIFSLNCCYREINFLGQNQFFTLLLCYECSWKENYFLELLCC